MMDDVARRGMVFSEKMLMLLWLIGLREDDRFEIFFKNKLIE